MDVERFLKYLKFEKRYSPHTIDAYRTDLRQFSAYCSTQYEIQESKAGSQVVRSWVVQLINDGIDPRSVNRKLSALKSFYRFLLKGGVIASSPMRKVIAPKTSKKLPQVIDEKQLSRLFDEVLSGEGYEGARDLMMLELLYATGMRRSELVGLDVSDISVSNMTIRVMGKGRKERLIPFGVGLLSRLNTYISARQSTFVDSVEQAFLLTSKGKRVYPRLVHQIVTKSLSLVSTAKKKSPHVLRHSFATHLLNHGAELSAIRDLLGHAGLAATQVYTHTSVEKLKEVHRRAHPKAG